MKKSLKGEFCDDFLTISYNYKVDIGFHSAAKMGKDTLILFYDKIIKQNNKLKQTSISLFLSHIVGKFHLSSRVDGFLESFLFDRLKKYGRFKYFCPVFLWSKGNIIFDFQFLRDLL